MKKILVWLIIIVFATVWYGFADLAGYTINNFDVQIDLNSDGSMQVEESIEVNFSEPRHGIYRTLPLGNENQYLSIDTITSNTPIHSITTQDNILNIQLGSPNITVVWTQLYTISYKVNNAIKIFSGRDELYWNIIGGERNTTIDRSTRTINLPSDYIASSWSSFVVRGYSGDQHTGDIEFLQTQSTQRRGVFEQQLQAKQGITVWLQFSWNYFQLPAQYDNYFVNPPSYERAQTNTQSIRDILWTMFPILIWIIIIGWVLIGKQSRSPRKSKKPIITQYQPPKDIDPSLAFYLRYNNKHEPKLFTSLIYYRATQWWIMIRKDKMEGVLSWFGVKDQYSLSEQELHPTDTSDLDNILLQQFFGSYDDKLDSVHLSENSYRKINNLLDTLADEFNNQDFTQRKSGFMWIFGMKELTTRWSEFFEHLRWYKEYLSKVEQPIIEHELQSDPDYINKILPWAVLFGVQTRLLKMVEEVLKNIDWYESNDGSVLTYSTFNAMNTKITNYSIPPRSSGSSWFSGWGGWFSWGGGWGGWGWSW